MEYSATIENEIIYTLSKAEIKLSEISNPDTFLETKRGADWIEDTIGTIYYNRWYRDNSGPYELKTMNCISRKIIKAKYEKLEEYEIEEIIEEELGSCQDAYDSYYDCYHDIMGKEIDNISYELDDLRDSLKDIPSLDKEKWVECVKDYIVEKMEEKDDSSVKDMFGSYDKCEIIIRLHEDQISMDRDGPVIDKNLQQALASIGYTVQEYRKHSGNKQKSWSKLGRYKIRPENIITLNELDELVAESCASTFALVLYAVVPITDIIKLDVNKPIGISNFAIASYNQFSGTFYDIHKNFSLLIKPYEMTLESPTGYTPDHICGLHLPAYYAEINNF